MKLAVVVVCDDGCVTGGSGGCHIRTNGNRRSDEEEDRSLVRSHLLNFRAAVRSYSKKTGGRTTDS